MTVLNSALAIDQHIMGLKKAATSLWEWLHCTRWYVHMIWANSVHTDSTLATVAFVAVETAQDRL